MSDLKALQAIRERHRRYKATFMDEDGCERSRGYRCRADDAPWPCDAAKLVGVVEDLRGAAQTVELHFQRNLVSDNFQGDDEHEAWRVLREALAKIEEMLR